MQARSSHPLQGLLQAWEFLQVWDRNKPSLSCLYLASILAYLSALFREKSWFRAFIYCCFSISKEGLAVFDVRRETHL